MPLSIRFIFQYSNKALRRRVRSRIGKFFIHSFFVGIRTIQKAIHLARVCFFIEAHKTYPVCFFSQFNICLFFRKWKIWRQINVGWSMFRTSYRSHINVELKPAFSVTKRTHTQNVDVQRVLLCYANYLVFGFHFYFGTMLCVYDAWLGY